MSVRFKPAGPDELKRREEAAEASKPAPKPEPKPAPKKASSKKKD